jgi:hypothetical protein
LALHIRNESVISRRSVEIRHAAIERRQPVIQLIGQGLPAHVRVGKRNLWRRCDQRLAQLGQLRSGDQGGQVLLSDLVEARAKSGDRENGDAALRDRK